GTARPGKGGRQPPAKGHRLVPSHTHNWVVRQLLRRHYPNGTGHTARLEGGVLGIGHRNRAQLERGGDRHLVKGMLLSLPLALGAPHPEPPSRNLAPKRHPAVARRIDPLEEVLWGRSDVIVETCGQRLSIASVVREAAHDVPQGGIEEIEIVAIARPATELV